MCNLKKYEKYRQFLNNNLTTIQKRKYQSEVFRNGITCRKITTTFSRYNFDIIDYTESIILKRMPT